MNDSPAVSILVPIYKVEKYLARCIDSVLAQDFTDWELILVDDGSPDRCPEICDEYAQKDERIRVVHKENGGLPSARLAGFKEARGKYVAFLDADDYLLPDALTTLYNAISKGYDMVRSKVHRVAENGMEWDEQYEEEWGEMTGHVMYQQALVSKGTSPYLHSAIYRASLFTEDVFQNLVRNSITVGEDWITNFGISAKVERLLTIDKPTFAYALNGESMINSYVRGEEYQKRISMATHPYWQNIDQCIKELAEKYSVVSKINRFFVPELPFSFENYHAVKKLLPSLPGEIKRAVSAKRLYFINCLPAYYCYTRLFCLATFIVNQKCRKRKILK